MDYLYDMLHEGVEGFPTERLSQLLRTHGLLVELWGREYVLIAKQFE